MADLDHHHLYAAQHVVIIAVYIVIYKDWWDEGCRCELYPKHS